MYLVLIYLTQTMVCTAQDRALASQQRAINSMCNSEQIGIETMSELAEQGEQLNRAEDRVKQIGELQKDGQRSINSLNSWFTGFKGMFSKKYVHLYLRLANLCFIFSIFFVGANQDCCR